MYVTGGLMIYFLDKLTLGTSVLAIRTLTALHSHCTHHCALVEHKGRRAPPPKSQLAKSHTHTRPKGSRVPVITRAHKDRDILLTLTRAAQAQTHSVLCQYQHPTVEARLMSSEHPAHRHGRNTRIVPTATEVVVALLRKFFSRPYRYIPEAQACIYSTIELPLDSNTRRNQLLVR